MDKDVPLLVPEINPDHIDLIRHQNYNNGFIVTNPNCSTIGLTLVLKPLLDRFGLKQVNVVTMQALSGAGYPGVASLDIIDNVIPFINDEEDKIENEPLKIFGDYKNGELLYRNFKISAQCNRVAVSDGHTGCIQVTFSEKPSAAEIIDAWNTFRSEPQKFKLPSAPDQPVHYFDNHYYPQPKLHRNIENGMAASAGRLREDPLFDYKFVILSHNTVRGAAGGAILCAELLKTENFI